MKYLVIAKPQAGGFLLAGLCAALAFAAAADTGATHYYLAGSDDASDKSAFDGHGRTVGWASSPGGEQVAAAADDPAGIYHVNGYVLRAMLPGSGYAFQGGELLFDRPGSAINNKMASGATLTIGNLRVASGVHAELRQGENGFTSKWAGENWVVEDGATLGFSLGGSGSRYNVSDATITGRGLVALTSGADDRTAEGGSLTLNGGMAGFEGRLSAYERGATFTGTYAEGASGKTLVIADPDGLPQATPDGALMERSIIVTNGAAIAFTCDATSPPMRGWDFGDGAPPTVDVAGGRTVAILGPVAGSAGFRKTGGGTLVLNVSCTGHYAAMTLTGAATVPASALAEYTRACGDFIDDVASMRPGQSILKVSGAPMAVESAGLSPAYGRIALAAGATLTCTAPAGYVPLSETKRAICTGWKLYDVNPETLVRTFAESGDTPSATVSGTGLLRELRWQWRIEYKVTVTAGDGGTAEAGEVWVEDGATATVSATPGAGFGFAGWSGDVMDEDRMKTVLSFTVDGRAYALAASFNPACYVATDGSDENDGLSPASPLATIGEALARGALHIYLAEGVYDITNTLAVNTATTIEGMAPGRGAVIRYAKHIGGYSGAYAVELRNNGAALRNLAVTTSANDSKYAYVRGVRVADGLIEDCAITNCVVNNGSYAAGGGVNMSGGIVRNSLLDGNSIYGAGGLTTSGGNINMSGGLVERCVVRRGGARNRTNLSNAGIRASGGTIRNCLIEGNTAAGSNGFAVYLRNATMENCTIVANAAPNSTSGSALYVEQDSNNPVVVRNTIVWGNTTAGGVSNWAVRNPDTPGFTAERVISVPAMAGAGNTDADPIFHDFANGDYHPTIGSARNAGVALDWMAAATDIDGNPRVAEGLPDIGCHEYAPSALDCSFDVSAGGALDSDEVTLAASVVGADLSGLIYNWTVTDQDGNGTSRSGAGLDTLSLTLGPGIYSVALEVENGAHDTASYARDGVVTVFPSHIYVSVDGANAMPFASYANGATNILDAVAFATSGTTIHVADGFYRYDSEIILNDAIRIVSENGPENAFLFCSRAPLGLRSVNLANAGAVVEGLTITGIDTDNPASGTHDVYRYDLRKNEGRAPGAQPSIGGLRITSAGGTATNCFIVNHRGGQGAGATITGGAVVDCLFTNNWNYCTGGSGGAGGGIKVDGANALVDRCAFLSNCVYYGGTSYGGGANVNSGTLRNCLFVGNQCTTGYGGNLAVRGAGARVFHCTAVKGFGSLGNGGLYHTGGVVEDCVFYDSVGNTTAEDTDDPGFANYPDDLHLSAASPAVDSATSGMGGDLDLDHAPRVSGPAADKGCFELDKSQFDIGIAYTADSPFSDEPVTLSALVTPEGALLDEAQTWWTFDGTEPTASNHDAVGSTVTRTFGLGVWTVRFKTVHDGRAYTADKPDWFTRYGRTVHLARENPGAAFPYGTPETAATNLSAAIAAAMDGATLLIGDGTFTLSDGVKYVGRNLAIRSVNGPGRTTIDANGRNAMFFIRSGDWKVIVEGIRFANGSGYVDGGAIRISDADSVVTNCVFDSCRASHYGGGGIYADAGTIVDCLFTNCWSGVGNGAMGAAIRAAGASCLIDRCILLDTHCVHDAATATRGALYINNGTVRNTVVARSRITGEGGILAMGGAKVRSCTVAGNVSELSGYTAGVQLEGSATARNTILWDNVNEADGVRAEKGGDASRFDHCFTDDPKFKAVPGREFQIYSFSPCRRAGVTEDWMWTAKDLYGNPRLFAPSRPVDIGAAECQGSSGNKFTLR